jgi:uroporphyrinogen decarboxylase
VIANPLRGAADLGRLSVDVGAAIAPTCEALRILRRELGPRAALIGFAGAPWTLMSYMVEGEGSKAFTHAKRLLVQEPARAHALLARLAQAVGAFLVAQVRAGAQAVQLFDSWVGVLSRQDYEMFVQPHSRLALSAVADLDIPTIHFGVGTGELLASMGAAGADVVGVDFRTSLTDARARLGERYAVQGNLDPALLFAPWPALEKAVRSIVAEGAQAPGHIFNLGHGVLPDTNPEMLTRVVGIRNSPARAQSRERNT